MSASVRDVQSIQSTRFRHGSHLPPAVTVVATDGHVVPVDDVNVRVLHPERGVTDVKFPKAAFTGRIVYHF